MTRLCQARTYARMVLAFALLSIAPALTQAQGPSGFDLVDTLRDGGLVIAMRHASSPRTEPEPSAARPDNTNRERELDDAGRASATAMGEALRQLDIPVGAILSSPTFRAVETVEHLGLGEAETFAQLNSRGRDTAWLLDKVATVPSSGTNTIIVTHAPNLGDAFGDEAAAMGDGEALILRPDGERATVIARVAIEDWPTLAAER